MLTAANMTDMHYKNKTVPGVKRAYCPSSGATRSLGTKAITWNVLPGMFQIPFLHSKSRCLLACSLTKLRV